MSGIGTAKPIVWGNDLHTIDRFRNPACDPSGPDIASTFVAARPPPPPPAAYLVEGREAQVPSCLEWGVERREECSEWQTTETEECQAWDQRCCSWQPCRFFCWVVTAVCTVWSNTPTVFCVIWTELTTYICLAWDVVTTVLGFLVTFIESTVGWLVDVIGFIIEIVEAIPVFGALVRWVHNFLTHVIATFLSLPDFVLFWMGIRPEKKLRLCTIVLTDENGQETASAEVVRALLQQAVDIFRREANVRIIPLRSFRLTSGFFGPEVVDNGWIHVDGGPPPLCQRT